ncbi:ricin B-like lectin [Wilcoxina mikolae CBS 423.85]|nr:ricin B-like lectin [Wilcoxina mikolae CBS 423.85]
MSANLCSGVYFIRSAATGTVVHVTGGHSNLVCSAQDYDQAGAQLFEFKRWNDRFIITNIGTKLVVDMRGGNSAQHTPVISFKYHGLSNQQWYIKREGDENSIYHVITNVKSGTVMDLSSGSLSNGTSVIGCNAHRRSNQQWEFVGVTQNMLGRQIEVPGPERVVEKIVPGPERVIERVIQGPEQIVVNFNDSPDTLRELRELRAQLLRAMEGLGQTLPKVAVFDTAGDHQSGDG